jgi:hypothetical protein
MLFMGSMLVWQRITAAATRPSLVKIESVNIAPVGWRRTVDGWELAERWGTSKQTVRNLNQWITLQRKQEASLAQVILERLRAAHPLVISTSLLVVVVAIAMFHERSQRSRRHNAICPSTE